MRMTRVFFAVLLSMPCALHAQLRPLEPAPWLAFQPHHTVIATLGAGLLGDQRLALAGTRGDVWEIGNYSITWRTGRVALTGYGTVHWLTKNETRERAPNPAVTDPRSDAGEAVMETSVRISPDHAHTLALLRFGTRIPTTSDESGLDRDLTDFFALLGARHAFGATWLAVEAGLSINGSHAPLTGQSDVLAYTVSAGHALSQFDLTADLVGHDDLHSRVLRGNEDHSELRLGIRTHGRVFVQAQWLHGFADYSPANGARITLGIVR